MQIARKFHLNQFKISAPWHPGGGELVTGHCRLMPAPPSTFPSALRASVSKDGGCVFSSHQDPFRSVFYVVMSVLFLGHTGDLAVPHVMLGVRKGSLGLAACDPHPAPQAMLSLESSSIPGSLWGLRWGVRCTRLGQWWSFSPMSCDSTSPLPHTFSARPTTARTTAFSRAFGMQKSLP